MFTGRVHGPWIAVFTARVGYTGDQHGPWTGCHFDTRVCGPCPQPANTGVILDTRVYGPCLRTAREHGPWSGHE